MGWLINVKIRASYTVEAALIYPIIIMLMSFFLVTSINMMNSVNSVAKNSTEACQVDSEKIFRLHHVIEKITKD